MDSFSNEYEHYWFLFKSKKGDNKAINRVQAYEILNNVATGLAQRAGNPLLEGEGKVGTYKELIDSGKREDNLTPHHMPSAEYMKNNGVLKRMEFQ